MYIAHSSNWFLQKLICHCLLLGVMLWVATIKWIVFVVIQVILSHKSQPISFSLLIICFSRHFCWYRFLYLVFLDVNHCKFAFFQIKLLETSYCSQNKFSKRNECKHIKREDNKSLLELSELQVADLNKTSRMKIYYCIQNMIHLMDLNESLVEMRNEFCAFVSAKNLQNTTWEILQFDFSKVHYCLAYLNIMP